MIGGPFNLRDGIHKPVARPSFWRMRGAFVKLNWLLVFIPIAIALDWLKFNSIAVFAASALAIVPLAGLMGDATEALAEYLGPTSGALLNATLGNAPEIIISLFALNRGLIGIVKSSLTGSIVGNLLLGLGLSMIAGGVKVKTQKFDSRVARVNGALLVLASFGLIIPAIYRMSPAGEAMRSRHVSLEISAILFLVYLGSLVFTLVTDRPVVGKSGVQAEKEQKGVPKEEVYEVEVGWSRNKALAILAVVTVGAGDHERSVDRRDRASRRELWDSRRFLRAFSSWPWSATPPS